MSKNKSLNTLYTELFNEEIIDAHDATSDVQS